MSVKNMAISVTNNALNSAAKKFAADPSAMNWARVTMTMKAHQFANFEPEPRIEAIVKRSQRVGGVVRALANAFDTDIIHLQSDVFDGVARLITAA